jgi:hypothetical protein
MKLEESTIAKKPGIDRLPNCLATVAYFLLLKTIGATSPPPSGIDKSWNLGILASLGALVPWQQQDANTPAVKTDRTRRAMFFIVVLE